ncbi:thiamine monophosphate kinase [Methylorubrum pseudosasae]|nr:thiamine monophosphate kinase [Methylorubrum pseudosasae]
MARAGEEALIARYFAPLSGPGAEGLRDDAASLTPTPGHDLVVTADAIVAGVHYFPDDPPGSISSKVLGVNLSDLAAKGATPRGFLLTLALPDDWTEAWLAGFAEGLGEASRAHGCPLLGGDTVRSGGPALIGVTAFGEVPAGAILRRQAARAGDRLCVSGTIGDAALGLALRLAPDPALAPVHRDALLDRYLHPRPRLALAPVLRRPRPRGHGRLGRTGGRSDEDVRWHRPDRADRRAGGAALPGGAGGHLRRRQPARYGSHRRGRLRDPLRGAARFRRRVPGRGPGRRGARCRDR